MTGSIEQIQERFRLQWLTELGFRPNLSARALVAYMPRDAEIKDLESAKPALKKPELENSDLRFIRSKITGLEESWGKVALFAIKPGKFIKIDDVHGMSLVESLKVFHDGARALGFHSCSWNMILESSLLFNVYELGGCIFSINNFLVEVNEMSPEVGSEEFPFKVIDADQLAADQLAADFIERRFIFWRE